MTTAPPAATPPPVPTRRDWRGQKRQKTTPRHRWQQTDWSERQRRLAERRQFVHRLWVLAFTGVTLALVAGFLAVLLFPAERTPMLIVTLTDYSAPLPPNRWAREDAASFEPLSRQTLDVVDLSAFSNSRAALLRNIRTALDASIRRPRQKCVIVYISAHGAVDSEGRPCLILPSSNALDAGTWLTIDDVLASVRAARLSPDVNILLVLDAGQLGVHWPSGQYYAGFGDGLQRVVDAAKLPNLAVLCSVDEGQVSHAAPELGGTVFGYFMRLGLQGVADQVEQGGDGDGHVQLHELARFVGHFTQDWVRRHRYDEQTPQLYGDRDFTLAWTYSGRPRPVNLEPRPAVRPRAGTAPPAPPPPSDGPLVDRFLDQPDGDSIPALVSGPQASAGTIPIDRLVDERMDQLNASLASVPGDPTDSLDNGRFPRHTIREATLDKLWATLDILAERGVYSRDPVAMERFRQDVLRLETLSRSGSYYRNAGQTLASSLFARVNRLASAPATAWPVDSGPMADLFGRLTPGDREALQTLSKALAQRVQITAPGGRGQGSDSAGGGGNQAGNSGGGSGNSAGNDKAGNDKDKAAKPVTAVDRVAAAWKTFAQGDDPKNPPRRDYATRTMGAWMVAQIPGRTAGPTLSELVTYIGSPEPGFQPGLVEGQWLIMLDAYLDRATSQPVSEDLLARAILTRTLGEQASTPADVRANHWVWSLVDAGDTTRRQAEDALMLDPVGQANAIANDLSQAGQSYRDAAKRASDAAYALAVRDRAYWELPHLAAWLTRRLTPAELISRGGALDVQISGRVIPLIEATEQLANNLEESLAQGAAETDSFMRDAARVDQGLRDLREQFLAECLSLEGNPADAATFNSINVVLEVPLIPADLRRRLRWRRHLIGEELVRGHEPIPLTQAETAQRPPRPRVNNLTRIATWGHHPAELLVEGPERDPNVADDATWRTDDHIAMLTEIAGLGQELRSKLAALPEAALDEMQAAQDLLMARGVERRKIREGRGLADIRTRSAVMISPYLDWRDAGDRVIRSDLHELFVRRAMRALGDFYGPSETAADDFFAVASGNFLAAGQQVTTVGGRIEPAQDQPIRDRRAALVAASSKGLTPSTPPLTASGLDTRLERRFRFDLPSGLPDGQAAVWIRTVDGPTLPLTGTDGQLHRRLPLPLSADQSGSTSLNYTIDVDQLTGYGPRMEAVSLFRGHLATDPFPMETPQGVERRIVNPGRQPTLFNIVGHTSKKGSVVLILDCSNSMAELMQVEGPAPKPTNRLDVARAAVRDMLDQLVQQGRYHVGVRFYGHRVARYLQSPDLVARNPDWPANEIPADLDPSEDVQQVLSLGRFTEVQHQQIVQRMEKLRPWGETPLYRAIRDAVGDFANDDPEHEQSIVVITDGLDYTFNPRERITADDVLAAMPQGRRIPLYIVGFRLAEAEQEQAAREFGRLASETGGKFFPANEATSLGEALSATLIRDVRFQVQDTDDSTQSGNQVVGRVLQLAPRSGAPHQYRVRLETDKASINQPLSLYPGQAVELYLSSDGRRLENRRYEDGDPEFSTPVPLDDTARTRYVVGFHRPRWDGPLLHFPVSFQQAEPTAFVPPPREVWIEITPRTALGDGTPEVFYDMNLLPRLPVAVVDCMTEQWPSDARTATINAWWKPTVTPPTESILVGMAETPPESGPGRTIPGATGMHYVVRVDPAAGRQPLTVTVLESYDESAIDLNAVKIGMSPEPAATVRRVDAVNRFIVHKFEYPDADLDVVRGQYNLEFTTRADLQADAFQLNKPQRVVVPRMPDVLRP